MPADPQRGVPAQRFPVLRQLQSMDCGPTCLKMVSAHHGLDVPLPELRRRAAMSRQGVSFLGLVRAAESVGFETRAVKVPPRDLLARVPLPCIVHWHDGHIVVVHGVDGEDLLVADPARGAVTLGFDEFRRRWSGPGDERGPVLLLEPRQGAMRWRPQRAPGPSPLRRLWRRARAGLAALYLATTAEVACVLLPAVLLPLLVPPSGIPGEPPIPTVLPALLLVAALAARPLLAQALDRLALRLLDRHGTAEIRSTLTSLLLAPVPTITGVLPRDVLQRIADHRHLHGFLVHTVRSAGREALLLLGTVALLARLHPGLGAAMVGVATLFLLAAAAPARADDTAAEGDGEGAGDGLAVTEAARRWLSAAVRGIRDLRLAGAERRVVSRWSELQETLLRLNHDTLRRQWREERLPRLLWLAGVAGTLLLALSLHRGGHLAAGGLLAVLYLLLVQPPPSSAWKELRQELRPTRLRLARLAEGEARTEASTGGREPDPAAVLELRGVSAGDAAPALLRDVDLSLPPGALAEVSEPTGLKKALVFDLLLGFRRPSEGSVLVGSVDLTAIDLRSWWAGWGTVFADSPVFPASVAENVTLFETEPDAQRLREAVELAGLGTVVDSLPQGLATHLDPDATPQDGSGWTSRMLVARALYRQPRRLLLDEATADWEPGEEKALLQRLRDRCPGLVVIVGSRHPRLGSAVDRTLDLAAAPADAGSAPVPRSGRADR